MGKLSKDLLVCAGGLSLPKPDRHKFHPGDSNLFLLHLGTDVVWIKLDRIEGLDRTEHMMQIIGNKLYIVGGHSFRNHVASEIFRFNQVLEIDVVFLGDDVDAKSFETFHRNVEVDLPPGLECNYITNFSYTADSSYLLFFGGYTWAGYQPLKQNMYELCPPHVSHHVKPKKSTVLFSLDLSNKELSYVSGQEEFATADGTLHILSRGEDGAPNNIIIVGGISGRVDLYSTFEFDLNRCSLDLEYGGCKVDITSKNRDIVMCIVPKCQIHVHRSCDTFTRGIAKIADDRYFCPTCADICPETRKKRPKTAKDKSK